MINTELLTLMFAISCCNSRVVFVQSTNVLVSTIGGIGSWDRFRSEAVSGLGKKKKCQVRFSQKDADSALTEL